MDEQLCRLVRERAKERCEYCQVPQEFDELPFHIDHIISQKQHGPTEQSNLALACLSCNAYKGPLTAVVSPDTGQLVPLFHPRQDDWSEHFAWQGAMLTEKTPVGNATIDMLKINLSERVAFREELRKLGVFPKQ